MQNTSTNCPKSTMCTGNYDILVKNNIDFVLSVSVIIPVYNACPYLRQCLDSVINQSLESIEIICIDDCSTDDSLEILKEYAALNSRIQVVQNKRNMGPSISRNIGIGLAKGQFVGFIDSDDYISPEYFEHLYGAARNHDADVSATSIVMRIPSGQMKNMGISNDITTIKDKRKIITTSGTTWNKIYKKSFIKKYNIYYPSNIIYGEDNFFTFLSIKYANYISYTDKSVYYYRENSSSIIMSKKDERCLTLINAYSMIKNEVLKDVQQKDTWLDILSARAQKDCTEVYFLLPRKLRMTFSHNYHEAFPALPELPDFPDAIISLTSYPARIATVNQTVQSLLQQDISFKKIILWLAKEQFPNGEAELPDNLKALLSEKFTIEWCTDIRSYKKLIPALKKYPDDIIVTADDDVIYPQNWLRSFVISYIKNPNNIHCGRTRRIRIKKNMILPYNTWPIKSYKNESYLNFFTGVGGVLYKKEFLHKDIMNENIFMNICKDGDDIWFWGMAVLQGTKIKSLTPSFNELDYIEGSQEENVSLWHKNVNCGENDIKLNDFLTLYPEVLKKINYRL